MSESAQEHSMTIQLFVVNERPFACWNYTEKDNLDFIRHIDHHYFTMQADVFEPLLQTDHSQRAATALRQAYSHALETLFALTYASLQAPICIQGWLTKYGIEDLIGLTEKVRDGQHILTRIHLQAVNWDTIVQVLYTSFDGPELEVFTQWYRWFADDFLRDMRRIEYNQVKHGFRGSSSPTLVSFQPEGKPLIEFTSDHGMSFDEPVPVVQGNRLNFSLQGRRINWTPLHMAQSLRVIAVLIHNIVGLLRQELAEEEIERMMPPEGITIENLLATRTHGFDTLRANADFGAQQTDLISGAEIIDSYPAEGEPADSYFTPTDNPPPGPA
jgi:hypothetical protein